MLRGKMVIDPTKLGINFNTNTGKTDNIKARSGFDITPVKYIAGYSSSGKPRYAYAPTITRKAYNLKLGGTIGAKVDDEYGDEFGKTKGKEIQYRDEFGELKTVKSAPSYTKEGKAHREELRRIENVTREKANEINAFKNEGKNLHDWIASGRSIEDWAMRS